MFPQIAKRKKKELVVGDRAYREWQEVSKELDQRAKLTLKKIPNSILNDFSKVCRIKSIPEFYANYFLVYSYRKGEKQLSRIFSEEMESMLTHQSHFHKISEVIKEREVVVNQIRESLSVVEGFLLMNEGKNIPLSTKGIIQQLVKGCQTLEELKELERKKTQQLAKNILKMRTNSTSLIASVEEWKHYLEDNSKNDGIVTKKIKIIYPHLAVNCLLLLFYDTAFLKSSVLKIEISFGKDEDDPFFQKMGKNKKGGQIQHYLFEALKYDTQDYQEFVNKLKAEIPSDEAEEQKEREAEREREQERLKAERLKEQKDKEEKIKAMKEQKMKALRQQKEKRTKNHRYSSLKKLPNKKEDSAEKGLRYKTSKGSRSEKKIINVDALLRERSQRKSLGKEESKKEELKIIGVYKKVSSKPVRGGGAMEVSLLSQKEEEIVQQKKLWQKEIKEEQQEKQKIKKVLKQTEKRAMIETRQFQEKLKKYEEEVANLKSRIDSAKRGKRNIGSSQKPRRSPGKPKKSINNIYGSGVKEPHRESNIQVLSSKLQEESKTKKNLESQIKELGKEKAKLQKQLEKESSKISKETNVFQKKLEKYEETINKLKQESDRNKHIIRELENTKINQEKKASDSMRMYTVKEREQELKQKILDKIQTREKKKKLRESLLEQKEKDRLNRSRSRSEHSLSFIGQRDLQIVKTKQTIEIVFEGGRSRKKKDPVSKELVEAEYKLKKLEKEREVLQKKLELSVTGKEEKNKVYESKLNQNEARVDRFKEQLQKERDRNIKLQENIRQMKKTINNEFQIRLNKERVKFEKEREDLLRAIEKEKEEKSSRDQVLEQQVKFLKEMEKNENELIDLLNREKKDKREKERLLLEEIQRKQELMNQLEIEEIKKTIEREVRKELLDSEQEEDPEENDFLDKKAKIEQEIERLKVQRDTQISELDEQNEKLKELIARIKGEQTTLLEAIRENIDVQSGSDAESLPPKTMASQFNRQKTEELESKEKEGLTKEDKLPNSSELMEELRKKTMLQYKSEEKKKQDYSDIEKSPNYKERQKIENLVEMYLKSPHAYPQYKTATINQEQKRHISQELERKATLITQFQNELFSTKELPQYVPSLRNDAINNHLLNLREAYQDYEADALRRELFPPLEEEVYNEKELSVESEEPPIVTMMDDVRAHQKKFSPKKEEKKNFLAINRVRLMMLEENRKQKQRDMIEEESRKKVQKQLFEKNRKKREEKLARNRQREDQHKIQKKQEHEKTVLSKHRHAKVQESKQRSSEESQKIPDNKSDLSSRSRKSSLSSNKLLELPKKKVTSEKGLSQSETERDGQFSFDVELRDENEGEPLGEREMREKDKEKEKEEIEAIKEQQIQQSIDQKEEAELQKVERELQKEERELLKSQIKSLQSEVRSYISGEEQFQVYQQFIKEEQLEGYVDQLMELSSPELKNLNGNSSLKGDLQTYCTVTVLVAKTKKGLEIGVGLFHKEYTTAEYVCDYVLAHKMSDFLNLVFNFSRFLYAQDRAAAKVEYLFDLQYIEDQQTLVHFLEFEQKCRRLGEVYVKTKNSKERKYILKRALFQELEEGEAPVAEGRGIEVKLRMLLFDSLLRQVSEGFHSTDNLHFTSLNLIMAYHLSRNPEELAEFRKRAEQELPFRELLVSALLFQKKQLVINTIESSYLTRKAALQELKKLEGQLETGGVRDIEEVRMALSERLPETIKRCMLQVGQEEVKYVILRPEEAVTRVQSSNSAETALLLSVIPKYKVMVIEAEEFLTMSRSNPDLTAFFYIKHFIKNIFDVKKESYQRVYLPELAEQGNNLYDHASQMYGATILLEETLNLGWKGSIPNSVVFTPKHRDLVIQKPFIVAVLSGAVERAVEGSPVCVRVVE